MKTNSTWFSTIFLLLLFSKVTHTEDDESRLLAELELTDLDLQDDCEELAHSVKASILANDFNALRAAEYKHGGVLREQSNNLKVFDNIPYNVLRNWTIIVKSGDVLLQDKDWNDLIAYYNENLALMEATRVYCTKKQQKCPLIKNVYEDVLQNAKNISLLKKSWSTWQNLLSLRRDKFPNILNLVQKAALLNDQNDPKSYWEMLMEQESAYEQADALWAEIQPLYMKLQNFVKRRIFDFYKIDNNSSQIPVYLLGSNFGSDWSYVADIVLPHPLIYHDATTYLKKISAQDMYKLAENLTQQLSLGTFGDKFWANSLFNMTLCENHVISYCSQDYSELVTCDKVSWVTYLNAFETAIDVSLRNINYLTLSRSNLRYSVIDEAIKSLGSVLAIANMKNNGILDKDLFSSANDSTNAMAELLLTALRVLPKLPFYLVADKWRLHLLENGFQNIDAEWWKFRKEIQGVEGTLNKEFDFLGDPYIMSNKPYISKFFGTILQFQLLQSYRINMIDINDNIAEQIGADENFVTMLHQKSSSEWQNLFETYYSSGYLSASSMLDYFEPLEAYLESAPLKQEVVTSRAPPAVVDTVKIEKPQLQLTDTNATKWRNKNLTITDDETDDVHPRHVHENLDEGPNSAMESISMYVGLGLLGGVGALMLFVIASKMLKRRKRNNNRRFET